MESIFSFGTGADMIGRGSTGVARPTEASALYWNPAYLDRVSIANANFFHTSFLGETPYDFFSVTYPTLNIGTFGVGVFRISTGDIQATDAFGVKTATFSFSQYEYLFSYGKRTDFLLPNSSLGVNLKIDNQQLFNESATGIGMDLAFHHNLDEVHSLLEGFDFGFILRNALAPSMRLSRERESMSRQLSFGVARSFDVIEGHSITPLLDIEKNFKRHWRQRVGFEYNYLSFLRFRFGITAESFSTGFGVSYRSFDFDYAMRDSDFMTNHLFSVSYKFGKTREEIKQEAIEAERARVEQEAGERLRKQRDEEIEKRVAEAERLYAEGDFFAALGEWQGVLAWDEDNEHARNSIEKITEELNKQEEERNIDIATKAAVKELFEAGIHSYTQKRYNDAMSSWARVLEIDPGHELAREYMDRASEEVTVIVKQHLDRAAAFHRVGEYASALNELHMALRYEVSNPDIERRIKITENRIRSNDKFRKGLSSYLSKDYDSALQDFRNALDLNPGNTMIREYIGLAEARKAGATTEIQPEMERLYLEGVDLYLQGEYEKAIEVWQRVLEKDPYNTKVLRNISEANERIDALNNLKKKK